MYYRNHRLLTTGNLTGMILFQCSLPWSAIQSPRGNFFRWLKLNRVYLNNTKFKTSTLVPCGFLHGGHPGYLCRNETEMELCQGLGITMSKLPCQLS
jgi:hypothetical protein